MEHLIPEAWFVGLSPWILLLTTSVGFAVLVKGADWLVEGAAGIAYRFGLPKVIVGATIVSLGTTSPEAAVSVLAAWHGKPGLALGNAVGSVIFDTGIIFGIGCLMTRLPADPFVLKRQGWVQLGSGALLAALVFGAYAMNGDAAAIGRIVGVALLALLGGYLYISVKWAYQHPFGEPFISPGDSGGREGVLPHKANGLPVRTLIFLSIVGLCLVLTSSQVVVNSTTEVAKQWGIPQVVISATLIAAGTSLPELVVGISSIRKGHAELLIGNVIGADILNVLFVVGASAAAAPLPIVDPVSNWPEVFLFLQIPTLLVVLCLFRIFIARSVPRGHFLQWYGVPLILISVTFLIAQIVLTR